MRFTFPNGEHPGLELTRGHLTVGASADDSVFLDGAGLKPAHARIELQPERRICTLRLAPGALAYVNARPVRSLALLRAGDVVMLNRVRLQLQGAVSNAALPAPDSPSPVPRPGGPKVVLRGVAGPLFGRSFRFEPSLSLGRSEGADICLDEEGLAPIQLRLHWLGDRCLASAETAEAGFELNGHSLSQAWVLPGDQLRIGGHRFVLEAPGMRPGRRDDPHTPVQSMRAVDAAAKAPTPSAPQAAGARGFNFAWLILAAAGIAGALVALILYAPR
jgi:hypothetical protein